MSATPLPRRGHFSHSLVATSGGLAPAGDHPGLRRSQGPAFQQQSRQHLPSDEARANQSINASDAGSTALVSAARAARDAPKPVGRRHLDPHHFTSLTDEAKRQEGRLGRARGRPPRDSLRGSALTTLEHNPMGAKTGLPAARRTRSRGLETSVELAEARLRRLANGNGADDVDPQKRELYVAAAQRALQELRGTPALVEEELRLTHRIASDAYAREGARRQAAMEAEQRQRRRSDALGAPGLTLELSTPFALDASVPRADTNLSVTGSRGIRVARDHNREQLSWTESAPTPAEEVHRRANEQHYVHRQTAGPQPYDSEALSGTRYPSPPPVGVSIGFYQRPLLVRRIPGQHSSIHTVSNDRDSDALRRASARALRSRSTPGSVSMERPPVYGAVRTEGDAQAPPRQPLALRERTEARWKREEAERDERRTGKARAAHHNRHTPLW